MRPFSPLTHPARVEVTQTRFARIQILAKKYPKAKEALLEALVDYGGGSIAGLMRKLKRKNPSLKDVQENTLATRFIYLLRDEDSGLTGKKEPSALVKALAELTGRPVTDFYRAFDRKQTMALLRKDNPEASEALLETIENYGKGTSAGLVRRLKKSVPALKDRNEQTLAVELFRLLKGRPSLTRDKKPAPLALGLAQLTGRPVGDFLDRKFDRDKAIASLRKRYGKDTPDAIIEAMADFGNGTFSGLARSLREKIPAMKDRNPFSALYCIITGDHSGLASRGFPNAVTCALAELTGKSANAFLRAEYRSPLFDPPKITTFIRRRTALGAHLP